MHMYIVFLSVAYIFVLSYSSVLQKSPKIPWTKRITNACWVLDKIGSIGLYCEKAKVVFLSTCNSKGGTRKTNHREGQRKESRPPTSWLKDIKSSTGMTLQEAVRAAEDRERWRRIVKTTASHNATSD